MCNKEKIRNYFVKINYGYLNFLVVLLIAILSIAQDQTQYTEKLTTFFIDQVYTDACKIQPWGDELDPNRPLHVSSLVTCFELGRVDHVELGALTQFMIIKGKYYPDMGLISAVSFGTNANVISLKRSSFFRPRRDILIEPRRKPRSSKTSGKLRECQNEDVNGFVSNVFTIQVPIVVSYYDEEFKEKTEEFIGEEACLLWSYFLS